jgi:hypothetical protein
LAQIHYFEKLDVECSPYFKGVKGRLAKHLEFWIKIEASDFADLFVATVSGFAINGLNVTSYAHPESIRSHIA